MEPYDQFRSIRYFGSLDALRSLAIIGVIWQHFPAIPHADMPFTDAGAAGVGLFFALSGFLITTLLLREEDATGEISLRKFYLRRSLRIFPLYYAVLGIYTVLVLLREHNAAGRLFFSNLPYYLTYTSNWFVDLIVNEDGQRRVIFIFAWSLATEEQFYLFWPVVFRFLRRHLAIALLVAIMVADIALTFSFGRGNVPESWQERLLKIATSPSTEICCGVLWALALHSKKGFPIAWKLLGYRWSAPAAGALALAVMLWPGTASAGWYLAMALVLSLLVTTCVIREDHGLAWFLQLKPLVRVGVVSYGVYMLHMLAVNAIKVVLPHHVSGSSALSFLLAVTLAYIMAEISFRLFESPILRMKARFHANPTDQTRQLHDLR
jgi:peptidoglycan/LPS O-acetylase OafA/YrhL